MDGSGSNVIGQLILIGILTLVSAFFSASEIALVSLNHNQIDQLAEEGNKKAKLIKVLLNDPTNFLATIQIGITLAGFFSSASAATGLAGYVADLMGNIPYANQIAIVGITMVLSYITLVFGELVPKRMAMQNASKMAMFAVQPITVISKIAMPFVRFLSFSTNILLKITRMNKGESGEKITREDIKLLARVGQTEGIIDFDEFEMIKKVIELDETVVREVMIPRTSTFTIDVNTSPAALADVILEEKYSRIPVYEGDTDKIIGILHIKDYFTQAKKVGFDHVDIRPILREPYFVPETKFVDDLLKDLQATQNHLAILIDEYGGFVGIATIEDLIEEIIGEIEDEHDDVEAEKITQLDETTYLMDGKLYIDDFNERFGTTIDMSHLDTMAGFVLDSLGRVPEQGDRPTVTYENFLFTVEEVKDNHVEKIKVEVLPKEEH